MASLAANTTTHSSSVNDQMRSLSVNDKNSTTKGEPKQEEEKYVPLNQIAINNLTTWGLWDNNGKNEKNCLKGGPSPTYKQNKKLFKFHNGSHNKDNAYKWFNERSREKNRVKIIELAGEGFMFYHRKRKGKSDGDDFMSDQVEEDLQKWAAFYDDDDHKRAPSQFAEGEEERRLAVFRHSARNATGSHLWCKPSQLGITREKITNLLGSEEMYHRFMDAGVGVEEWKERIGKKWKDKVFEIHARLEKVGNESTSSQNASTDAQVLLQKKN